MYLKSMIVFVLCTAFVVGFYVVLTNDANSVNSQLQALPSSTTNCESSAPSCPSFSIVSVYLQTMNTTDQLGISNPVYLSLQFNVSRGAPLSRVSLFVGNASAGTVQGPFGPGLNRIINLTLPATISASPGRTYVVSAVGFNGQNYVTKSFSVVDQPRGPPSP